MAKKQSLTVETPSTAGAPRRYRVKLLTMGHVRHEMARIYRECRSGLVESQDGSRLVFMLASIGKVIEGSDLEKRIEALEQPENE